MPWTSRTGGNESRATASGIGNAVGARSPPRPVWRSAGRRVVERERETPCPEAKVRPGRDEQQPQEGQGRAEEKQVARMHAAFRNAYPRKPRAQPDKMSRTTADH